jgi:hypothetical protein
MATSLQRLTVLGETFEYQAPDSTAGEITRAVEELLDPGTPPQNVFPAVRSLLLRHADTIEPEGAPRCDLVRRVFADEQVRNRIADHGGLVADTPALTAVDLSYGQLVSLGSYDQGRMRYTPLQAKTIYTIATWIGEGAIVGRGYELVESRYRLPVESLNVYRKPTRVLDAAMAVERRETLRTLLRDGMPLHEALETSALL